MRAHTVTNERVIHLATLELRAHLLCDYTSEQPYSTNLCTLLPSKSTLKQVPYSSGSQTSSIRVPEGPVKTQITGSILEFLIQWVLDKVQEFAFLTIFHAITDTTRWHFGGLRRLGGLGGLGGLGELSSGGKLGELWYFMFQGRKNSTLKGSV